jgi:TPR repeat protein
MSLQELYDKKEYDTFFKLYQHAPCTEFSNKIQIILENGYLSQETIMWLSKKAEEGNLTYQITYGYLYRCGYYVDQDNVKAVYWFKKGAEQGCGYTQYNLGLMYYSGYGVDIDYKESASLFLKSAEQGLANAQYRLAIQYELAQGVEKDYKKALYWYTESAKQGFAEAQYNLGRVYQKNKMVPKDYKKAIYWYTKGAEQKNTDAQYELAHMYHYGIKLDCEKAAYWYQESITNSPPSDILTFRHGKRVLSKEKCGLRDLLHVRYIQTEADFNKMNDKVGKCFNFPQLVKSWLEMKRMYTKKVSFDTIYKHLTDIPKDIIEIMVDYL